MLEKDLLKARKVSGWEQSAKITTSALFQHIKDYSDLYNNNGILFNSRNFDTNHVLNMKSVVNYMIDYKIWNSDPYELKDSTSENIESIRSLHYKPWATLSLCSISFFRELDPTFDFDDYQNWIAKVVISKQRDYGPKNISRFGINGLVIRIHDKIARLENLVNQTSNPQNESITDTLLDIVGYSIVALMWINGTFLYELTEIPFVEKNLTTKEFFHSIEESPIPRHTKTPITSNRVSNTQVSVKYYDTDGKLINSTQTVNVSYTYPNPGHPNIKFR